MENQEQNQNKSNVKLMFDVMPQGMPSQKSEHQQAQPTSEGRVDSATPPMPREFQDPENNNATELAPSRSHIKLLVIALVVIALGVGGYFGYQWWSDRQDAQTETQTPPAQPEALPKAWLQQYFGMESCNDVAICGLTADVDGDKFTNEQEAEALTSPLKVDSDSDGLADGDELNVYSTDPIVADSDGDGFEDGTEIRNGFSPVVVSDTPAAAIELSIIVENINKFGLHAATQAFLALKPFSTNFGSEDGTLSKLSIGISGSFTQDMSTINPIVWNNTTASSTLVLSRSIVSATSTTESLVDAAVAANENQYAGLTEVTDEHYSIGKNEVIRKSFSFTDQGEQYRMDVVYLRAETALLTGAFIVPTRLWADQGVAAESMLNSLRAAK